MALGGRRVPVELSVIPVTAGPVELRNENPIAPKNKSWKGDGTFLEIKNLQILVQNKTGARTE